MKKVCAIFLFCVFTLLRGGETSAAAGAQIDEGAVRAAISSKTVDTIACVEIHDYDNDGTEEAFIVTAKSYDMDIYEGCTIWFYKNGSLYVVEDKDIFGYPKDIFKTNNHFYFVWEKFGGGSSSVSYVYGVKDGSFCEANISKKYMDFGRNENGEIFAWSDDWSKGYHDIIEHVFKYNPDTREFYE